MKNKSTVTASGFPDPEIWGGIECTINRVENEYRDQLEDTGHYKREDDLALFAELGIKKIRYPVLWERHERELNETIDWTATTTKLEKIRKLKIEPVVGLLHHGSGPAFTHLEDPAFPALFARYAAKVSAKFPWIKYYTPVNEPLTTARFSGLYGAWYPHKKDDRSFVSILLHEIKATILAMQEIRKNNPDARLLQTEDLSRVHSSPSLSYQAEFENHRRWLTYDLLCGRVDIHHPLWHWLQYCGATKKDLNFFIKHPCPPDIMGFNYYVTSERYLDEELERYPSSMHGGNGKHSYVDTEAVRLQQLGLSELLREAWERFTIPIAITECHLACTREEQIRWLHDTWTTCRELCKLGVDIKGVTAWALLGAYDWNSLLTKRKGYYESGVFQLLNGQPRPTAIAKMVKTLAHNENYHHPLLLQGGWWKKEKTLPVSSLAAPVIIIGKHGTLARAFSTICLHRNIPVIALSRKDIDILSAESIRAAIDHYRPWAMINASGYLKVDDAEANQAECFSINATAPALLAQICNASGIPFMSFSTDLVFDGNKISPYHETDAVKPLNIYGASKAEGERRMLHTNPQALIIRTSAFFGPWDIYNFPHMVLENLNRGSTFTAAHDVVVSPTYVPDLVNRSLDLLIDGEYGIWHLANKGMTSWADLAIEVAERGGLDKKKIISCTAAEMNWAASRPLFTALESETGIMLPSLDNALERYFHQKTA
ncbi:MAG TPA: family 1 glycosylhydrolase [Chitinophagaceae bacterium]|nr:family 1 glycosylhydrolase [Chitinophagaceae bacterium]